MSPWRCRILGGWRGILRGDSYDQVADRVLGQGNLARVARITKNLRLSEKRLGDRSGERFELKIQLIFSGWHRFAQRFVGKSEALQCRQKPAANRVCAHTNGQRLSADLAA